jgi:hypothetical protein
MPHPYNEVDDIYATVQVRVPIRYVEKKVYVTDAGTAVMVIEEIKRFCEEGYFHTLGRFDKDKFMGMMHHLTQKYSKDIIS